VLLLKAVFIEVWLTHQRQGKLLVLTFTLPWTRVMTHVVVFTV